MGPRLAVGVALLAAALVPAAAAGTGYRAEFDFPGHGDDWYGRDRPDVRRDFAADPVDFATDGDDFGHGYELLADPFGFGPPLASTQAPRYEYLFRFGDRPCDPRECFVDSNCGDGTFCNGSEICTGAGNCSPGALPDCSDPDACTLDRCDVALDACVHDPLSDPGEVPGLTLGRAAPASSVATLSWIDLPAADTFNVYRGEKPTLGDLTCYYVGVAGITVDDEGDLPASGLFEYLVSSVGCGGESTLGADSAARPRVPAEVCP